MTGLRRRVDAVSVLTLYLVVLFALPSRLGFAPLGGAGSPASILGAACFAWWLYAQVQRSYPTRAGSQPVRAAYLVIAVAFLISYVFAMTRAIEGPEASTAGLGLISLFSWGGVLLIANDGPISPPRLLTLIRRLVLAGALEGALGIMQFVTGQTWVDRLSFPGLTANQALGSLSTRSGLNRPPGTALHAIEFGVVLTMLLPIALSLALTDKKSGALRRWLPVTLILVASVISISRSAIVGLVVGLLVVAPGWPRQVRRASLAIAPLFAIALFVTIPGLLGTLSGLFTGIGTDSSAASRTGSYAIAGEFIERSPVFGRGYATFLPSYRILDNQYLLLFIEVGAVGLVAVLGLLVTGMVCAELTGRRATGSMEKQLSRALTASIAVGGVSLALFDAFSFPLMAGTLFLVLGLSGAMWRLSRQRQAKRQTPGNSVSVEQG